MAAYSLLMILYGVFLLFCGFLGWGASGFTDKAMTAVISGAGSGSIMMFFGWLSSRKPKLPRMLGAHFGLAFPILFGSVFTWRAIVAWQDVVAREPKALVAALLTLMALASFAVFGILLTMRPIQASKAEPA